MTSLTAYLVLATCAIATGQGQMVYSGKCPNHKLQSNFDISKYTGSWHVIARTFAITLGHRCVSYDFELMEEGTMVGIVKHGVNIFDHKVSKAGKGMVDPKRTGRMMIKVGKNPFWSSYNVLKTDYDNYAIVWACGPLAWFFHTEKLWILSRERTLSEKHWMEIWSYLNNNNIRTKSIKMKDQKNCGFDFYN